MSGTEFTLYDVVANCRSCGEEFPTKAFSPAQVQRWGLCLTCEVAADRRAQARFKPPKPEIPDIEPPRRIWEPE